MIDLQCSSESPLLLDHVKQVICACYSGHCKYEERERHIHWLSEFERSNEFWVTALELLHDANVHVQFSAASLLSNRVANAWLMLKEEEQHFILERVLGDFTQRNYHPTTMSSLCRVISYIIFYTVPKMWTTLFEDLYFLIADFVSPATVSGNSNLSFTDSIHSGMNQSSIKPNPSTENPLRWLQLMTILLEELEKPPSFLTSAQHYTVRQYISAYGSQSMLPVLNSLIEFPFEDYSLNSSDQSNQHSIDLQPRVQPEHICLLQQALICLETLTMLKLPLEELLKTTSNLANLILKYPIELGHSACNILCNLFEMPYLLKYEKMTQRFMELVIWLEPLLLSSIDETKHTNHNHNTNEMDKIQHIYASQYLLVHHLSRLYMTLGKNVKLVFSGPFKTQICKVLLKCAAYRNRSINYTVPAEAFSVWRGMIDYFYSEELEKELYETELCHLVEIILSQVQAQSWSISYDDELETEAFEQFREQAALCLREIFSLMSDKVLLILHQHLSNAMNRYFELESVQHPSQSLDASIESEIDAILFCCKTLLEEDTQYCHIEWTSLLVGMIPKLPRSNHRLQTMALDIIGSINMAEDGINAPPMIMHLIDMLKIPTLISEAANALKKQSLKSPRIFLSKLPQLFQQLCIMYPSIDMEQRYLLISSLVNIASLLPVQEAMQYIAQLVATSIERIKTLLAQIKAHHNPINTTMTQECTSWKAELLKHLQILITIISPSSNITTTNHDSSQANGYQVISNHRDQWAAQVVLPFFQTTWQMMDEIIRLFPHDDVAIVTIVTYFVESGLAIGPICFYPLLSNTLDLVCLLYANAMFFGSSMLLEFLIKMYRTEVLIEEKQLTSTGDHSGHDLFNSGPSDPMLTEQPSFHTNLNSIEYQFLMVLYNLTQTTFHSITESIHRQNQPSSTLSLELIHFFTNFVVLYLTYTPCIIFENLELLRSIIDALISLFPNNQVKNVIALNGCIKDFYMIDPLRIMKDEAKAGQINEIKNNMLPKLVATIIQACSGRIPRSILPKYAYILQWFFLHFPAQLLEALKFLFAIGQGRQTELMVETNGNRESQIQSETIRSKLKKSLLGNLRDINAITESLHQFYLECAGFSHVYGQATKPF